MGNDGVFGGNCLRLSGLLRRWSSCMQSRPSKVRIQPRDDGNSVTVILASNLVAGFNRDFCLRYVPVASHDIRSRHDDTKRNVDAPEPNLGWLQPKYMVRSPNSIRIAAPRSGHRRTPAPSSSSTYRATTIVPATTACRCID